MDGTTEVRAPGPDPASPVGGAAGRRAFVRGLARALLSTVVVVLAYFFLPLDHLSDAEIFVVLPLALCGFAVAIGFEVVDSHFPKWRLTAAEAVADFGVHAALVVGEPWPVGAVHLREVAAALESLRVTLGQGETVFAEGEGRNALGSPLLALGRLAAVLASQPWAPPLAAGEVVSTGTLTPLPALRPGERWRVTVAGAPLPPLELLTAD